MKKSVLFSGLMMLALVPSAFAQQRNNGAQNQGGGVMPLPEGVKSVVSIDAYNILLAEVDRDGERGMAPIIVRHVYSGGIAKLFGGGSVPTEQFVSPGAMSGGNGGNGGNRGGRGGQTGFSGLGNNGGNGTFGTGFNGGNGFNTGGFNGNNGFNTGGFNGNNGFGGNTFGGGFGNGNIGAFQIRPTPRN